jgi:glutathione S-transferase
LILSQNLRGLGEIPRLVLVASGLEWVDDRIGLEMLPGGEWKIEARWAEMKERTPFGQAPILEVDGHVLAQSNAIVRFAAQRGGLAGHSDLETALLDSILEFIMDLYEKRHVSAGKDAQAESRRLRV